MAMRLCFFGDLVRDAVRFCKIPTSPWVNLKVDIPTKILLDKSRGYKRQRIWKTKFFHYSSEDLIEMKENNRRKQKPPEKF